MFLIIAFRKRFRNITIFFLGTFWLGTQIWNMIYDFFYEFVFQVNLEVIFLRFLFGNTLVKCDLGMNFQS